MDIIDELNLPGKFNEAISVEDAFDAPLNGHLKLNVAEYRNSDMMFEEAGLPIELQQIKISKNPGHLTLAPKAEEFGVNKEQPLFTPIRPSIDYQKVFKDFHYFFNLYPLISFNNFKPAQKLFVSYFSNRKELNRRLFEFKKVMDKFSTTNDKFGKLNFEFKVKEHSLQITLTRSRLKGVTQNLSISLAEDQDFICFTQWNWKRKKEELIRSRNFYKNHIIHENSLSFDAKVWQTFNHTGLKKKNFMKSLDCLERNKYQMIDFINAANKKNILTLIEKDLFSNVTIKSDNQDTLFLNFLSNMNQKVNVKMTSFASCISVG